MMRKNSQQRNPIYALLPLTLFLVVAFLLSACGGQANPAPDAAPPTESSTNQAVEEPAEAESPEATQATAQEAAEPTAAPTETAAPVLAGISFSAEVFPILQSRCINCHGGDRTEAELVMRSYEDLMVGGESGPVVLAEDAANSLLVQLITEQKMPKRGPKLTPVQIQLITDWVNQGAQNN